VLADRVGLAAVEARDGEGLAFLARDFAADELCRDLEREIAEVRNAPQPEDRGRAVLDERLHVVREPESSDLDRVRLAGGLDDLGGREDSDRGRGYDDREVRGHGAERLRLLGAL